MKRNQLKELGLTAEQIDKIMDLNGDDINKAKSNSVTLTEENESLKAQIADRDKDLKKLQGQLKDNEDVSKQFKDLQAKYKQDTEDLNHKLTQTKLNGAIDNALSKNNARNATAVKALLNMDSIKLDDAGKLTGLDDQLKSIKQSDSYLFNEGSEQKYEPSSGEPAANDETQAMVDVFKK